MGQALPRFSQAASCSIEHPAQSGGDERAPPCKPLQSCHGCVNTARAQCMPQYRSYPTMTIQVCRAGILVGSPSSVERPQGFQFLPIRMLHHARWTSAWTKPIVAWHDFTRVYLCPAQRLGRLAPSPVAPPPRTNAPWLAGR